MNNRHDEAIERSEKNLIDIKNIHQKKLVESRQSDEYKKINKHREGLCYLCWEIKYVTPDLFDVCFDCAAKKGKEPILAIASRKEYGFCFVRGHYNWKVAQINARLCTSCARKVREKNKELRKAGTHQVDPFWKYLQRKFGKDYKILMQQPSSYRK